MYELLNIFILILIFLWINLSKFEIIGRIWGVGS